jgi:dephospho-CoA kinase
LKIKKGKKDINKLTIEEIYELLTEQDILKRIKCQLPQKEKVRLADFVIDNDGSIGETRKQVTQLIRHLRR